MAEKEDYVFHKAAFKGIWITLDDKEVARLTHSELMNMSDNSLQTWAGRAVRVHMETGRSINEPVLEDVVDRLRQQIDKPRSLVMHATVPIELLEDSIKEITNLRVARRFA